MITLGLGNRISYLVAKKGVSLKEVATKANIPYTTLYSMVKRDGKKVKYETLEKIAQALDISVNDILEIPDASSLPGLIDSAYMDNEEKIPNVNEVYRQEKLMEYFFLLNQDGQEKAVERVEELTEIPKYQKDPPPEDSGNG